MRSLFGDKNVLFWFYFPEGEQQETIKAAQRSDDAARVQRHRFGAGPRPARRHATGEAEESVGRGRMDGALERKELGMGRAIAQGQGIAQRSGAQRRRVLVSNI